MADLRRIDDHEHSAVTTDSFAKRLRTAMAIAGVNKEDLAKAIGVDPKTVGNWATDEDHRSTEPKVGHLVGICNALDTSADFLLGFQPSPRRIRPGAWIVDEAFVAAVRRQDGSHTNYGEQGSFEVPVHWSVYNGVEHRVLENQLAPLLSNLAKKKGGRG